MQVSKCAVDPQAVLLHPPQGRIEQLKYVRGGVFQDPLVQVLTLAAEQAVLQGDGELVE